MELVIDNVDEGLLREELLLSARFGSVRRQVVASKAPNQSLNFPKPEGKAPQSVRFDLLSKTSSAWLVLRPGDVRYTIAFTSSEWQEPKCVTVRASNGADAFAKSPISPVSKVQGAGGSTPGGNNPFFGSFDSLHSERYKSVAQDAKAYLDTHKVVTFFHALLHAVIRERPEDPYAFMSAQFPRDTAQAKEQLPVHEEVKKLRTRNDELNKEVEALKKQNRELRAQLERGGCSSTSVLLPRPGEVVRMKSPVAGSQKKEFFQRRPTIIDDDDDASKSSPRLDVTPTKDSKVVAKRSGAGSPGIIRRTQSCLPIERRSSLTLSFTDAGALKARDQQIQEALMRFWGRLRGEADSADEFRVLRQSVTTGRWTLYTAGGKASKPHQYSSSRRAPRVTELPTYEPRCPFCVGNEHKTPDPLLAFDADGKECESGQLPKGWRVRVIPNIFPLLVTPPGLYGDTFMRKLSSIPHSAVALGQHQNNLLGDALDHLEDNENPELARAMFRQVNAVGYSEVIVENSVHNGLIAIVSAEQVALGLRALQSRGRVLAQQPGVRQLLYFKQYGALSGGSLVHPHMQVVTLPLLTPETQNRISRAVSFHQNFGTCAVCQANVKDPLGQGAHSSRLVHKTEHFMVVVPFASSQYRVSIVPRVHSHSWLGIGLEEINDLAFVLQLVMEGIYHCLDDPEYNIYIFSVDCEEEVSGGEEAIHWLMEVHPRFPAELGGMELASGIRVISGCLPEDWAQRLRKQIETLLEQREAAKRPQTRASAP